MVRNEIVSVWDDTKINAGAIWREEIRGALVAAKVAVLLVSPKFLASDFIAKHELPPLLDAAKKEGLVILWVYISHCLYDETEIERYQAANEISKPLDSLAPSEQNAVLVNVCRKIKAARITPIHPTARSPASKEIQVQGERDAEDFYTELGVKRLIDETSGSEERSEGAILIYKTQKQHTWLVATYLKIYCIVDDFNRRTCALHLLQSGVDIAVIALWLGHENIQTTHGYIEADLSIKERALQKMVPAAWPATIAMDHCSDLRQIGAYRATLHSRSHFDLSKAVSSIVLLYPP